MDRGAKSLAGPDCIDFRLQIGEGNPAELVFEVITAVAYLFGNLICTAVEVPLLLQIGRRI